MCTVVGWMNSSVASDQVWTRRTSPRESPRTVEAEPQFILESQETESDITIEFAKGFDDREAIIECEGKNT